jgi:hypothetical protein
VYGLDQLFEEALRSICAAEERQNIAKPVLYSAAYPTLGVLHELPTDFTMEHVVALRSLTMKGSPSFITKTNISRFSFQTTRTNHAPAHHITPEPPAPQSHSERGSLTSSLLWADVGLDRQDGLAVC